MILGNTSIDVADSSRINCGRYHGIAKVKWRENFKKSKQCQMLQWKWIKQELGIYHMKVFSDLDKSTLSGVVKQKPDLWLEKWMRREVEAVSIKFLMQGKREIGEYVGNPQDWGSVWRVFG